MSSKKESQREAKPLLHTSPPLLLKERGIKGERLNKYSRRKEGN